MKNFIWMIKSYFHILVLVIIVGSTMFSFPSSVPYAAAGDPPSITITSPANNQVTNTKTLTGTFTDDNIPTSGLLFSAYENNTKISDSLTNSEDWSIADTGTEKTWRFTGKPLLDGIHTLTVKIKENVNPVNATEGSADITFTVDMGRPFISAMKMIIPGQPDLAIAGTEDFTKIPLNAKIRITIADDNPISNFINDPVKLILDSQEKMGDSVIESKGIIDGKYQYVITFSPQAADPLIVNRTYLVYINPALTDDANNPIYTRFFKFTTKSNSDWGNPNAADDPKNPHGNYSLKTNMCATCHSTHVKSHIPDASQENSREGGSYLLTFNDQLTQKASESYCMACHDGTVSNAPIIDKISSTSHHASDLKEAATCTSCHNPHLQWSETNQNLLKDHVVYEHVPADIGKKQTTGDTLTGETLKIDSLDQACDSCHESNEINLSIPGDAYKVLSYKKANSAVGKDDYSLCLRCHNTSKKLKDPTLADIDQYYTDPSSGHYFALEGNQTQADGSTLNGPIPCAECHETHGSNVDKMLREQLGNVRTTDKFTTKGATWSTT